MANHLVVVVVVVVVVVGAISSKIRLCRFKSDRNKICLESYSS